MNIKFCGIRNEAEARMAIECGADWIGLVFVPESSRRIPVSRASAVSSVVGKRAKVVGVFQNQSAKEVEAILNSLPLDILQFHGEESKGFVSSFGLPVLKAIGVNKEDYASAILKRMEAYEGHTVLLDRKQRGQGILPRRDVLAEVSMRQPFMLAGGLDAERAAIYSASEINFLGMDVSSGIRTGEVLDRDKCLEFAHACGKPFPNS